MMPMALDNPSISDMKQTSTSNLSSQQNEQINKNQKSEININRTNLEILLSQNDILPLLKKVNHQSKLMGRQITLSEFVMQKNVSELNI